MTCDVTEVTLCVCVYARAERQPEDGFVGLHQALSAGGQREAQHGRSVFQHVP